MSCNSYNGCSKTNAHNVELHCEHNSTDDKQNSMEGYIQQKRLLYSQSVAKDEEIRDNYLNTKIYENRILSIRIKRRAQLSTFTYKDVTFYKEWPGRSPTVNISWFIAKTYLSNFYYTTQCDAGLTMKACDDIIDVYRQSESNQLFAEETFPFVLSTYWSSIYDKEIQELLGFYSLFFYVLDKSSNRSEYFDVCPVQFALYLRLRAVTDTGFSNKRSNEIYVEEYSEHLGICKCKFRNNTGGLVLVQAALHHYWITITSESFFKLKTFFWRVNLKGDILM